MLRGLVSISSSLLLVLGFAACGGSKPPAAPAQPEAKAAPAAKAEPADKHADQAPAQGSPSQGETRTRKPAKDFLLGSGWDFVLSFGDSDLKAKAEEQCAKKSGDDGDAAKACVAKAGAEAANDRLKLAPDDKGGWWLIYMGKVGGKETLYTKLQFKLAKDEPDKLVLTPVGKDQGKQPMKKLPSEIVLEMPDEYSVIMQHPERGKLVFSVKVTGEGGTEKKP